MAFSTYRVAMRGKNDAGRFAAWRARAAGMRDARTPNVIASLSSGDTGRLQGLHWSLDRILCAKAQVDHSGELCAVSVKAGDASKVGLFECHAAELTLPQGAASPTVKSIGMAADGSTVTIDGETFKK